MPGWLSYLWYAFWSFLSFWGLLLGSSLRLAGTSRIPRRGPVLIIANHQSFLDPVLVGVTALPRFPRYLARQTLFGNPVFGWFIGSLGAVPVDHEGVGKEGIKTILHKLKEGAAVVVFPEGTRTPDGRLQQLRPGITLLIKRVEAPIVPLGIAGAHSAWPHGRHLPGLSPLVLSASRATLAVSVGRPLDGRRYAAMPREQLLDELFQQLEKVQEAAEKLRRK